MEMYGSFLALIFIFAIVAGICILVSDNNSHKINVREVNSMKYCSHCGAEVNDNAVVCVKCGCALTPHRNYYEDDVPSAGLNVLSAFFPIIGLILYIVYHENKPIKANAIGKWAIIGFIVGFVFSLLMMI